MGISNILSYEDWRQMGEGDAAARLRKTHHVRDCEPGKVHAALPLGVVSQL